MVEPREPTGKTRTILSRPAPRRRWSGSRRAMPEHQCLRRVHQLVRGGDPVIDARSHNAA